jgi:membrane-associated phospholipid phosphatase
VTPPVPRDARGLFIAAVATVLLCAPMYVIPQHWHWGEPVMLPLTKLDRAIPFWPASGLLYFGAFVFLLLTFIKLWPERERAVRFLYVNLLAQTLGMLFFLLWPTTYPRELYPLPPSASGWSVALTNWCRSTDAPVNCLPSLHVSTVTICVAALRGSRWFLPALLIGVPLALSTLTFKQHYVADVITGLALGLLSTWTINRVFRQRGFT